MNNEMNNATEGKVKVEANKEKTINLTYTGRAYKNVLRLQTRFQRQTGVKISQEKLVNRILETATL